VEFFPEDPEPLPPWIADRLRREILRDEPAALLDLVLERVCEVNGRGEWLKGTNVPPDLTYRASTGEAVKPRRVWRGPNGATLPVFMDEAPRLGAGRGRRAAARVVEWLRRSEAGVALLTNGRQLRLVHAGLDHDAWAEWDVDLWFEEGAPSAQVTALRALLAPEAITPPTEGQPSRLLAAILATRKGQAELSAELGERVRRAVELLIRAYASALDALDDEVNPRHVYLAAVRTVMRMVVAFFAEARELLPRGNPVYEASYGLQALRDELERVGHGSAGERLRRRHGAWPRILALFRLIHDGSGHQALPIIRYDGGLFAAGDRDSPDPMARALSIFEDPANAPPDSVIQAIFALLTRSRVRVRQGRASTWVEAPVDFGDLSSEYIGILYEGLLDYELRRADSDDPVLFLRLGDEPALPLSRLEALDDRGIRNLLDKLKAKKKTVVAEEASDEEEEGEDSGDEEGSDGEEGGEESEDGLVAGEEDGSTDEGDDRARRAHERALAWARRVAGDNAPALLGTVVAPGEWYLVRFGGTRKGSGTFYTRPALAVPTAHRTLRPLAYVAPTDAEGRPDELAPAEAWTPRLPEEILGLNVCDPACGSGSFLVAALRFMTDALAESLHHHGRIAAHGDQSLVTLAEGKPGGEALKEEPLPCRPTDEDFEERLRARLKRHVVEHCLYGVDLDPLAVELCRLSLWVETMDRELPFTFLDHKIRCGNALVGCWFDRFRDYPALSWDREGGDKGHGNGVHFEKAGWTNAIKEVRNDRVKAAVRELIAGQYPLFQDVAGHTPEEIHDEALQALEALHDMAPHDTEERARYYRERIAENATTVRLKEAFDTWCSLWFWPADRLDDAPLPATFASPSEAALGTVRALAAEHRFFHWELEFPDVFARAGSGFDAVLGNPPWEIQKPNSKEYFSNLDPLYRTYGKQEALRRQEELFALSERDERDWLVYSAGYKALANFLSSSADPFALGLGRGTKALHEEWRRARSSRSGYADPEHPFRHQGSADVNTYKLFVELARGLLRPEGRLGLIVPSGLYTDKGSTDLRVQLLAHSRWRWLFGFENREKLFDIDSRFKFCPVIVEKGGETESIYAAFMRRDVDEWAVAERIAVPYERAQIERFSPNTFSILEIRNRRDLEILEKIYANGILLGDQSEDGWGIQYATEFHMTNDSKLFPPRPAWEEQGYRGDEYGRWLLGDWRDRERGSPGDPDLARWDVEPGVILSQDGTSWIHEDEIEDVALPLYEGRMIGQFDFSQKGWVSGKGRGAVWEEIPWERKVIRPQYLMAASECSAREVLGPKLPMMNITSATNSRTVIASLAKDWPCNHSLNPLRAVPASRLVPLTGLLNSFVFDAQVRARLGGLNLSFFILDEVSVARPDASGIDGLRGPVSALSLCHPLFAPEWIQMRNARGAGKPWRHQWAVTESERLRMRCVSDSVAAALFGLGFEDITWLLRGCDNVAGSADGSAQDAKGFWRVDRDQDPELRQTVLTIIACQDLEERIEAHGGDTEAGIAAWLAQNDGGGWMIPDTLRLADLELGHDGRAKQPQAVRERLGPRFLPWQLEQTPEESWRECELHARNLLGVAGFEPIESRSAAASRPEPRVRAVAEPQPEQYDGKGEGRRQADLFE
jgi:hypothetical protein